MKPRTKMHLHCLLVALISTSIVGNADTTPEFDDQSARYSKGGAHWIEAGTAAVVLSDQDKEAIFESSMLRPADWPEDAIADVRQALNQNQEALETLHKVTSYEGSWLGPATPGILEGKYKDPLAFLTTGRLLLAEARVSLLDHDQDRALVSLETMARLSEWFYHQRTITATALGISVERMMLEVVGEAVILDLGKLGGIPFLQSVEATILTIESSQIVGNLLNGWNAGIRRAISQGALDIDLGPRGSMRIPEGLSDQDLALVSREVLEVANTVYGRDPTRFDRLGHLLGPSDEGIGIDLVAFARQIGRLQAVEAQRQLLRAAIALRGIALDIGEYPTDRPNIDLLVHPDPFTGDLIAYRHMDDGSLRLALDRSPELLAQLCKSRIAHIDLPPV